MNYSLYGYNRGYSDLNYTQDFDEYKFCSVVNESRVSPSKVININLSNERKEAIKLIDNVLQKSMQDIEYYKYLMSQAMQDTQKDLLKQIIEDKQNDYLKLQKLLYNITGTNYKNNTYDNTQKNFDVTYDKGLNLAIFNEFENVDLYQKILRGMENMVEHNIILDVLTNVLKHQSMLNFLIHNAKVKIQDKEIF